MKLRMGLLGPDHSRGLLETTSFKASNLKPSAGPNKGPSEHAPSCHDISLCLLIPVQPWGFLKPSDASSYLGCLPVLGGLLGSVANLGVLKSVEFC